MKIHICLIVCLTFFITQLNADVLDNIEHVPVKIDPNVLQEMITRLYGPKRAYSGITAELNEYFDKLLVNLGDELVRKGYDPTPLPNSTLDLLPLGSITLERGWLSDLSTLTRYEDCTVSYSSSTKILNVEFALEFDTLRFTYDYETQALLLKIHGGINGKVQNVRVKAILNFDFNIYNATLQQFDVMDTGKISVTFTGNGLVDWITNAMSSAVTTFLHPIILAIIQSIGKGFLNNLVNAVNEGINNIIKH